VIGKQWFELNPRRDGSPITIRRQATRLAYWLETLQTKPHLKGRAIDAEKTLEKSIRYALARIRPKSPDARLLSKAQPLQRKRGVSNKKQRSVLIALCMNLRTLTEPLTEILAEEGPCLDLRLDLCVLGAETIRELVRNENCRHYDLRLGHRVQSMAAWAKETGFQSQTIRERLKRGWTVEMALTVPEIHNEEIHQSGWHQIQKHQKQAEKESK